MRSLTSVIVFTACMFAAAGAQQYFKEHGETFFSKVSTGEIDANKESNPDRAESDNVQYNGGWREDGYESHKIMIDDSQLANTQNKPQRKLPSLAKVLRDQINNCTDTEPISWCMKNKNECGIKKHFTQCKRTCGKCKEPPVKYLLKTLYRVTNGTNWNNNTNWNNGDPCKSEKLWYGVTCRHGKVTGLDLHMNDLKGTIPTELGKLTELKVLSIFRNYLKGTIPTELGMLTKLTVLNVYRNDLAGTLPSELGMLFRLDYINVDLNNLADSIPTEICALKGKNIHFGSNFLPCPTSTPSPTPSPTKGSTTVTKRPSKAPITTPSVSPVTKRPSKAPITTPSVSPLPTIVTPSVATPFPTKVSTSGPTTDPTVESAAPFSWEINRRNISLSQAESETNANITITYNISNRYHTFEVYDGEFCRTSISDTIPISIATVGSGNGFLDVNVVLVMNQSRLEADHTVWTASDVNGIAKFCVLSSLYSDINKTHLINFSEVILEVGIDKSLGYIYFVDVVR